MRLINPDWGFQIQFEETRVCQLIIESPSLMRQCIMELKEQARSDEGKYILLRGQKELRFSKQVEVIVDSLGVDVNNRKALNGLFGKLKERAYESDYYLLTNAFLANGMEYIEEIAAAETYALEWNLEVDVSDMFKLFGVRLQRGEASLAEDLLQYMEAMREYCGIQLFLFANLKDDMEEGEMKVFYRDICYQKIPVLLIESREKYRLPEEKTWIIDKDLCEIY